MIRNDSGSTSFTSALLSGDLPAVRACPKADLHTHGFAKADRDYVREKTGHDIEPVTVPLRSMDAMHEWAKANIGVWRAVEVLELDEVQHGIAAAESATVMRFLADRQIRLNICPTSNLLLGRVARLQDHPIRKLFDAGVKVTVNSDDAIVSGVGVSEDFLRLYQAGVFTAAELDLIRRRGLED
jgi:hypothetical protein